MSAWSCRVGARHYGFDSLRELMREIGVESLLLATEASERRTYLARPDLGRKLAAASLRRLQEQASL